MTVATKTIPGAAALQFKPFIPHDSVQCVGLQGDGSYIYLHLRDLTPESIDALASDWLDKLYALSGRPHHWRNERP